MTTNTNTSIPQNLRDWKERAAELSLLSTSMHDLPALKSASTLEQEEFITLRAIWPPRIAIDENLAFGSFSPKSKQIIDKCKKITGLRKYLKHIADKERHPGPELGAFMLVRDAQLQIPPDDPNAVLNESNAVTVTRRSTRIAAQTLDPPARARTTSTVESTSGSSVRLDEISTGESASAAKGDTASAVPSVPSVHTPAAHRDPPINDKTKDEEIVNVALLEFLRTITLSLEKQVTCTWSMARAPFAKVEFGDNTLTARVDGYLQGNNDSEIFAIVEVKPGTRNRFTRPSVLWQETAEMVAWIMHDRRQGRRGHSYWLVSQDHDEIYLTQATFNENYIKYLLGDTVQKSAHPRNSNFLKMQEYGPWRIDSSSNMESLAKTIVALVLDVTKTMRQSNVENPQGQ